LAGGPAAILDETTAVTVHALTGFLVINTGQTPYWRGTPGSGTGDYNHQANTKGVITMIGEQQGQAPPDIIAGDEGFDVNPVLESPPDFEESVDSDDITEAALDEEDAESSTEEDEDEDEDDLGIDGDMDDEEEVETEEDEDAEEAVTEEPDETTPKADTTPKGVKKRINKLTAKVTQAETDRDRYRDLYEQGQAREETKAAAEKEIPEPQEDDFDDYDTFIEAKVDWKADKKVELMLAEGRAARDASDYNQRVDTVVAAGKAKFSDYEARVITGGLHCSDVMTAQMVQSDQAVDLTYHLATHPKELDRINALKPDDQIKAIGIIEHRIKNAGVRKTKKIAPSAKPTKPIGGGGTTGSKDPSDFTMAEMRADEAKQRAKRRAERM